MRTTVHFTSPAAGRFDPHIETPAPTYTYNWPRSIVSAARARGYIYVIQTFLYVYTPVSRPVSNLTIVRIKKYEAVSKMQAPIMTSNESNAPDRKRRKEGGAAKKRMMEWFLLDYSLLCMSYLTIHKYIILIHKSVHNA